MLMANKIKIVGIVLLVIGSIWLVSLYYVLYGFATQGWGFSAGGFIFVTIINSKSPDTNL